MNNYLSFIRRTLFIGSCLMTTCVGAQALPAKRPMTVADAIELRRPVLRAARPSFPNPVIVSPNGKRYVTTLVRDDIERGGSWVEIVTGRLDSMAAATEVKTIARLFTTSREDSDHGKHPFLAGGGEYSPVWLADNERVVFPWSDDDEPTRLTQVDTTTGEVKTLTENADSIVEYGASADGEIIVYTTKPKPSAEHEERMARMLSEGFAVKGENPFVIVRKAGYDGRVRWYERELFVRTAQGGTKRLPCKNVDCSSVRWTGVEISSDGRYAVLSSAKPSVIPDEWDRYSNDQLQTFLKVARKQPLSTEASYVSQLVLLDFERQEARALWNAPDSLFSRRPGVAWSPNAARVILGPVFTPVQSADAAGLEGTAFVEIDIVTGRVWPIPVPADQRDRVRHIGWRQDGLVEMDGADAKLYFRKKGERWQLATTSEGATSAGNIAAAPVRVELRSDDNTPPALYAVETATGREQLILDIEPKLGRELLLGQVERVEWRDRQGKPWQGTLYHPIEYSSQRKYPLVIQLTAFNNSGFSALGASEADLVGAPFAAQPLAARGVMTLTIHPQENESDALSTAREGDLFVDGVESAIKHLDERGMIVPEKVGLVGFSRTGWRVLHVLTQSKLPYAAAVTSSNVNYGYIETTLNGMVPSMSLTIGAQPFGDGIQEWIKRSPGFNTEKIKAALRMENDIGGVHSILSSWEIYSRMRHLQQPVELVIVPDSDHSSHPLLMPKQKLFSIGGTVDWMDFWLNGREDSDPSKAAQYERWRELRRESKVSAE